MHQTAPLEITGPDGKPVNVLSGQKGQGVVNFFGMSNLPPGRTGTGSQGGEWADSTLTIVSMSTATTWRWKLPPGEYRVRAVGDFQDFPFQGAGVGRPPGMQVYSQAVVLRIEK